MTAIKFLLLTSLCLPLSLIDVAGQSIELFDNETLDGWTMIGELETNFEDDEILLSASETNGLLLSNATYDHFVLHGDVYLDDQSSGALLFRHVKSSDYDVGYAMSLHHSSDLQNPTGSLINVARGTWIPAFDTAGWFSFELMAKGDYLTVKFNDVMAAQTHNRMSKNGHLGFKIGKESTLRFRDLTITTIAPGKAGPEIRDYFDGKYDAPFTTIFDGQSLDGWTPSGEATWEVIDGALHGFSGAKGGFLISSGAYKNFQLILDFKIIKDDNSGIFIRRPAEAENVTLQNSVECNIYDHNGYAHAYSTGSLATHARAWNGITNHENWNTAEILAWEDQIAMYINGVKASHADLPSFNQAGNICLQAGIKIFSADKGPSNIYFRNIRIKSLD